MKSEVGLNVAGIELVNIYAGSVNRALEGKLITIADDFYIGKYPVTQGQWKSVMGSNPSHFSACGDNCPVEMVSWDDITKEGGFLDKLNNLISNCKGLHPSAGVIRYDPINVPAGCFRLPTEDESEYAHRAGTETRYYWGDSDDPSVVAQYAWYYGNSYNKTHPVGQKLPNDWGLYDMSGNVWEWLYSASTSDRVRRGGGFVSRASSLGSEFRFRDSLHEGNRHYTFGFRLVLVAPQP
jgi:formylglycine-generating enzyme required for sulfatase activity